jgi:hypothetical protein
MMKVWVLTINHRHGSDVRVYATEALAKKGVQDWVRENWEVEIGSEPMPDDIEKACAWYWEAVDAEWADIRQIVVEEA